MSRGRCVVGVVVATGLAVSAGAQESFQWTGGAADADWNDELNWSNLSSGGVNGFPGLADTASFDVSTSVFRGEVLDLNVAGNTVLTLGVAGMGSSTTVAGIISNQGTIAFLIDSTDNQINVPDQRLTIPAQTTVDIVGTGSIELTGSQTGFQGPLFSNGANSTLMIASGHTVSGHGIIQDLTVDTDAAFDIAGGSLVLSRSTLVGAGQYTLGADATLSLNNATFDGGTIHALAGSRLNSAVGQGTLANAQIEGEIVFGGVAGASNETRVSGAITNNGVVTFEEDDLDNRINVPDQQFVILSDDAAAFGGTGSVVLNGAQTGFQGPLFSAGSSSTLTNGAGHTIEGDGIFQDLTINQDGTLAVHGGAMVLQRTSVSGPGGIDIAADAVLTINTTTIDGGVIDAVSGGRLNSTGNGGVLAGLRVEGELVYGGVGGVNCEAALSGVITNNAVVTFEPDDFNNRANVPDQQLLVLNTDSATLAGTGSVVLSGIETGFQGPLFSGGSDATLINGAGHTIRGHGILQDLTIMQDGTVDIVGGTLLLQRTTVSGPGAYSIAADGVLTVNDTTIEGGTISAQDGSRLSTTGGFATIRDVAIAGDLAVGGANGANGATSVSGVITNAGTITFVSDDTNNLSSVPDQQLAIAANDSVEFAGGGTVVLSGLETGLQGALFSSGTSSTLVNAIDHTISGRGILQDLAIVNNGALVADGFRLAFNRVSVTGQGGLLVVNAGSTAFVTNTPLFSQGTIDVRAADAVFDFDGTRLEVTDFLGDLVLDRGTYAPGAGDARASSVSGDFEQTTGTTVLEIELGGAASGAFDQLSVQGDATLAGRFEVAFVDGFRPLGTESFDIVSVGGTLSGTFAGLGEGGIVETLDEEGRPGSVNLFISYQAGDGNDIRLTADYCPADINLDGRYTGADFNAWLSAFSADNLDADQNGDGVLTGADFNAFITNFLAGCG